MLRLRGRTKKKKFVSRREKEKKNQKDKKRTIKLGKRSPYLGRLETIGRKDIGKTGQWVSVLEINVSYPDKRVGMDYGFLRELEFEPQHSTSNITLRVKLQTSSNADALSTIADAKGVVTSNGYGSSNIQDDEIDDVSLAAAHVGTQGFLIDFKIYLIIKASSEDNLRDEIDYFDKLVHSSQQYKPYEFTLLIDSVEIMNTMHDPVPKSSKSFTMDNLEFTYVLPYPKGTIADKNGIIVGHRDDIISNAQVSLNFNKMQRRALVAFDDNKTGHLDYAKLSADLEDESTAEDQANDNLQGVIKSSQALPEESITLQRVANQNVMSGHRSINIMLNQYDPRKAQNGKPEGIDSDINRLARLYDVSKTGINMMQVFGNPEKIGELYPQQLNKLVEVFNQLSEGKMETAEKHLLREMLDKFYTSQQLHTENDENNAKNGRLGFIRAINTPDKVYPTVSEFYNTLLSNSTYSNSRAVNQVERDKENFADLKRILETTISAHRTITTAKTEIGHENFKQLWFTLKAYVTSSSTLNAMLMNTLFYVNSRLKAGDMVLIHGCEKINLDTWNVILPMISTAELQGVKFVFGFSTLTTQQKDLNGAFDLKGYLFNNMYDDFDWLLFSNMSKEQGTALGKYIDEEEVNPDTIKTLVARVDPTLRFFVRKGDRAKTLFRSTINS